MKRRVNRIHVLEMLHFHGNENYRANSSAFLQISTSNQTLALTSIES